MSYKDQVTIININWSTGNPHIRTSMVFGITWEHGFQPIEYNPDLALCGHAEALAFDMDNEVAL